jgi:hypothetical protein
VSNGGAGLHAVLHGWDQPPCDVQRSRQQVVTCWVQAERCTWLRSASYASYTTASVLLACKRGSRLPAAPRPPAAVACLLMPAAAPPAGPAMPRRALSNFTLCSAVVLSDASFGQEVRLLLGERAFGDEGLMSALWCVEEALRGCAGGWLGGGDRGSGVACVVSLCGCNALVWHSTSQGLGLPGTSQGLGLPGTSQGLGLPGTLPSVLWPCVVLARVVHKRVTTQ